MTLELVQTGIHLAIIQRPAAFTDTLEQERFWIQLGIDSEDVQHNPGGGAVITASDDVAIADDKYELALVIVVECSQGVDGPTERVFALSIARHLTKYEFVLKLRCTLASKLQSSQDWFVVQRSITVLLGEEHGRRTHTSSIYWP